MSSPTKFTLGAGAVLSISVDGGTTFVPVKQLKTISYTGNTANYEDVTNMDSPAGVDGGAPVQEFAPTTVAAGTAAVQGVFNDNDPGQILLAALRYTQQLVKFKHQFKAKPGQTTGFMRTFSGYVMECNGPDSQFDKSSTLSGQLKISGVTVDTPGTVAAGS